MPRKPDRNERRKIERQQRKLQSITGETRRQFFSRIFSPFSKSVKANEIPKSRRLITRRKLILGSLATGGTLIIANKFGWLSRFAWLETRIKRMLGLKNPPKLFFCFTIHRPKGGRFFLETTRKQERLGNPFNVILLESAGATAEQRIEIEKRFREIIPRLHEDYKKLVERFGERARQMIKIKGVGDLESLNVELLRYAVEKNLSVKLIEEYGEIEEQN